MNGFGEIRLSAHSSRMQSVDNNINSGDKSPTKPPTKTPAKLKPWQEKLLLEYIEKTNQPIQDFDLLQACNSKPRIFGVSATELRCLYQYRFKYLKTLPIDKYVNFLRKYGQNPSATTQRLLLEATTSQGSGKRAVKKFGKTGMQVAKFLGRTMK